jgi:hypothetical protein
VLVDKINAARKGNAPARLVVDRYILKYRLTNRLNKHQLSF